MQDKNTPIGILPLLLFGWSPPLEVLDTSLEPSNGSDNSEPVTPKPEPSNPRRAAVTG